MVVIMVVVRVVSGGCEDIGGGSIGGDVYEGSGWW